MAVACMDVLFAKLFMAPLLPALVSNLKLVRNVAIWFNVSVTPHTS
jgi:hypothetical protein